MRKIYLLFIITALCTAWLIVFYLGVSSGFSNYVPIIALLGSVALFVIAAPLIVYLQRAGLYVGLLSCLLMLPYSLMFILHLFRDYNGTWHWGLILILLPSMLVLLNVLFTVNALFVKKKMLRPVSINNTNKLLFSFFPVLLFAIYLVLYGRYWDWQMFKL